jgi:plastocyanin
MRTLAAIATLAVSAALVVAACGTTAAPAATKRTIYMSAVEYKGGTEVAKEPFPAAAVPGSGGYILKKPVDGRWETSTYRWEPGTIVVYQGDDVELQIWGVNGADHPGRIEGYDRSFNVKRGQLTTVSFTADKAGVFRILCDVHNPSMTGTLVVLAR